MRDFSASFFARQDCDFNRYLESTDPLVISENVHGGVGVASMTAAIDAWWRLCEQLRTFCEEYQELQARVSKNWVGEGANSFVESIAAYDRRVKKVREVVKETAICLEAVRAAYVQMHATMPLPCSILSERTIMKYGRENNLLAYMKFYCDHKVQQSITDYYIAVREFTNDLASFPYLPYS